MPNIKPPTGTVKKALLTLTLLSLLALSIGTSQAQTDPSQPATLQGWQVENDGGYCSESDGVFRLWSESNQSWSVALYKEIKPVGNFTFVYQVKADAIDATGLFFKRCLPIAGQLDGINFEYGHYQDELFLLARNYPYAVNWMFTPIAHGELHKWFTVNLTISDSPLRISSFVYDENSTLIGSHSTTAISNFTFGDIKYISLIAWGGNPSDVYFRVLEDPFGEPPNLSISTETQGAAAGSAVNVYGTLTDPDGLPLVDKTVVLSYTFRGANTWIPVSSDQTDENGNYNIQWINTASGTFTLKTEWAGDTSHVGASNTTMLSFLPIQNQQVFTFESNSTVTALAFNNETSALTFNVTGPTGSTGYVRATIAKSMLANGTDLQATIDGSNLNYTVTSTANSWVFFFAYSHSTHQIALHLSDGAVEQPVGSESVLVALVMVFGGVLGVLAYSFGRGNKRKTDQAL